MVIPGSSGSSSQEMYSSRRFERREDITEYRHVEQQEQLYYEQQQLMRQGGAQLQRQTSQQLQQIQQQQQFTSQQQQFTTQQQQYVSNQQSYQRQASDQQVPQFDAGGHRASHQRDLGYSSQRYQLVEDASILQRDYEIDEEIHRRPRFLTPFKSLTINEGQTAHFECKIEPSDDSTLKIEWFQNSKEIQVGSRWQHFKDFGFVGLNIFYAIPQDSGTYTCRISNNLGSAESSVTLQVNPQPSLYMESDDLDSLQSTQLMETFQFLEDGTRYQRREEVEEEFMKKPRFLTPFKSLQILETQSAHFECKIEPQDDPHLVVDWFHNGKPLNCGTRWKHFNDFGFISLDINHCVVVDTGVYTCRISNKLGYAEASVSLQVIPDGGNLALNTLHPDSLSRIRYLEDENRHQRMIYEDESQTCAPKFLTPFKSLTIQENQVAHFECRIEPTTDPRLRIEWYHNGRPLMCGSRFQSFHDFGFVCLNILQCVDSDSGKYTCRIVNDIGSAEQSTELIVRSHASLLLQSQHPSSLGRIRALEEHGHRTEMVQEQSGEAPRFVTPFTDVTIPERRAAHFEARIEPMNDPDLKVEWFCNQKELQNGSRWIHFHDFGYVSLDIHHCVDTDTGMYTCRISNKYGFAECSVTLKVIPEGGNLELNTIHPDSLPKIRYLEDEARHQRITSQEEQAAMHPRFLTPFKSLTIQENQVAHFECRIEPVDDPHLTVEWFHGDKPIHCGSRWRHLNDFGFISLDISQTVIVDSGTYTCRISNKVGSAEASVTLQVVPDGGPLALNSLHPESLSQIRYLEDENRHQRTVREDELQKTAPKFLTPFKSLTIQENQIAHYECRIEPTNDPRLRIEWYHNEKPLMIGSRFQSFHDFGFVCLNILQCIEEDSGTYKCKLINEVGTAEQSVELKVISQESLLLQSHHPGSLRRIQALEDSSRKLDLSGPDPTIGPPKFLTPMADITIKERFAAHFECRIEPTNDPDLKIEWFHNGKPLSTGSRWIPFHDFGFLSLNIMQCLTHDSGKYTCKISNKLGSAESSVNLTVISESGLILDSAHPGSLQRIQYLEDSSRMGRETEIDESIRMAPKFLSPFADVEIPESYAAHYECRIEPVNDPKLKVEWFHDGKPIIVGSRFQSFQDFGYICLNILQSIEEDSGQYTCKISNEAGSAEQSAKLSVKSNESLLLRSQHPDSLSRIQALEDSSRKVEMTLPQKSGIPPRFLTPFVDVTVAEQGAAHFEARIEPTDDSDLTIEWYFNNKELHIGSRWIHFKDFGFISLDIMKCLGHDSGTYTCRIKNKLGQAECSVNLKVVNENGLHLESQHPSSLQKIQMLEDSSHLKREKEIDEEVRQIPKFLTPFDNVDIPEGNAAHFECKIEPTSDPTLKVEWYRNGKQLMVGSRYQTFHDFGHVFLNILQCVSEDSGTYVCKATNCVGSAEQSVELLCSDQKQISYETQHPEGLKKIQEMEDYSHLIREKMVREESDRKNQREPPIFVMPPEPVIVPEGDVAKFQCRVTGYPRPRMMWVLNGNTCVTGSKFKLSYDGIYHLEVPKCKLSDTGKVEVYARNIVGEAHCTTTLEVRPRHEDYRVVLKNSPRPWYDHSHARYQKERYESELEKVFEEKLTPGGTEIKLWRTEQNAPEGGKHVKVQEQVTDEEAKKSMPDVKRYKTDIFFADKSSVATKPNEESQVSWMAKSYQSHVKTEGKNTTRVIQETAESAAQRQLQAQIAAESKAQSSEASSVTQTQVQKEVQGDLEVTRHIKQRDTLESQHKVMTKEIKVSGPVKDIQPPIFKTKLTPIAVQAGNKAAFNCVFTGKPTPVITWYRENFQLQNSPDFEVSI